MSKVTTSRLFWLPSAGSVSAVPDTAAFTYGNWVQLTASAPSDLYAAYLAVLPNDGATGSAAGVQIQIGIGAAAAEVPIHQIRFRWGGSQVGMWSTIPLGLIASFIPAGTRVALRVMHQTAADVDPFLCALGYYTSLGGATGFRAIPAIPALMQANTPTDGSSISVAGTTAWANGAYSDIIAANAVGVPLYLTGLTIASLTVLCECDIALGTTPTVVATVPCLNNSVGVSYFRFPNPIRVEANIRVAARQRANTSDPFDLFLWYALV